MRLILGEYVCPATRCRQIQQQEEPAGKLLGTVGRLAEETLK
jgi:hypothetical protein